jgi:hypothetical protein
LLTAPGVSEKKSAQVTDFAQLSQTYLAAKTDEKSQQNSQGSVTTVPVFILQCIACGPEEL